MDLTLIATPEPTVTENRRSHDVPPGFFHVVQRIAVFREDDQLLARRGSRQLDRAGVIEHSVFRKPIGNSRRRENLGREVGQLTPFCVIAASTHGERECLKLLEGLDFSLQLGDRP